MWVCLCRLCLCRLSVPTVSVPTLCADCLCRLCPCRLCLCRLSVPTVSVPALSVPILSVPALFDTILQPPKRQCLLASATLGLWLRLECSLDCISGSVGHQQNIFIFSLSAFLLKLKKCNYKKCNWVSGSPSILYKLVLSPVPIIHTNFQENLLMSYSWCPQLSR